MQRINDTAVEGVAKASWRNMQPAGEVTASAEGALPFGAAYTPVEGSPAGEVAAAPRRALVGWLRAGEVGPLDLAAQLQRINTRGQDATAVEGVLSLPGRT